MDSDNGFGWQPNEVVGASIVSVPLASASENADSAFRTIMVWIVVVFVTAMLVVNAVVYLLVVRPVRRIAAVAEELSVGNAAAGDFPPASGPELTGLTRSFNRMRTSLREGDEAVGAADMKARDVFVSYSQPDRECAFQLVAQLESQGIGVWVAPRDISPATDWAEAIIEAISGARLMVLVFSATCNASPQVRREVERAVHREIPILPFRIEDVLPARSLEYFLSTPHWLDAFPPPREPHFARLSAHIEVF